MNESRLALDIGDTPIPSFKRYLLGLENDTKVLLEDDCKFIVILRQSVSSENGVARTPLTSLVKPSKTSRRLSFKPTRS
jgi:hypothetical protein